MPYKCRSTGQLEDYVLTAQTRKNTCAKTIMVSVEIV